MTNIIIISDCFDNNARGRQLLRYKALIDGADLTFIGSENAIQAAGNLVDALDSLHLSKNKKDNIFIVNVASRGDNKYKNGIPFCFSETENGLIIGTPNCFSLAQKLGLLTKVKETDVLDVCRRFLPEEEALRISESQFRSFEYLPLLTKWLYEGKDIPIKEERILASFNGNLIWNIDNFGNCKTTILSSERKKIKLDYYPFKKMLAKVPNDLQTYFVEGSSGFGKERFLELVVQGNRAAVLSDLSLGTKI